jgi:hypothetical protein
MKTRTLRILLAWAAGLTGVACAFAQNPVANRAGHWEFYLFGQYWTAEDGTIPDVTLPSFPPNPTPTATSDINFSFDDTFMYGFGFAYNFSNKLATRFEFGFGYPNYEMKWNGGKLSGEAWVQTGKVNVEYNFFDRPLTPFVSAGLGYLYIDTGIPSGPPEFWYWWDYYWGPIVTVSQPTVTEWCLTYNAAIGLRWDISDRAAVRAAVAGNWVEIDNAAGTMQTIEFTLGYSWKW